MTTGDWQASPIEETGAIATLAPSFSKAQLVLAYQPVIGADGQLAFQEGLARLRLPDGQLIAPDAFLPALEADGRIAHLDRLILRRVATHMIRERRGRFSINISGRTVGDAEWLATLALLARNRPDIADRLLIEITESAVYDGGSVHAFLHAVRSHGPAILLDDFGTGYTAIRQLRDLPLDGIKLDGSFSRGIERDPDNRCIVKAMVDIAAHFELLLIAERVETRAEARCLTALGVDAIQGHVHARPAVPENGPALRRA